MPDLAVGSEVVLCCPDNTRLHGARARVEALTDYGARVSTPAAATGAFRALFAEMLPAGPELLAAPAREQGFSGDCCDQCGGCRMRRNGSCLVCEDCGATSGCS